ncbi:unnamed protein product [Mytilus coruscus]|uniref:Novel STAND NTPase 3 domain-containing protein n=1 Tax=Mytilus coruscus TaxID=42192 RepID=A0A6J8DGG7_MYTCO|nr:unnamed protein product [Mytilus coruscus]
MIINYLVLVFAEQFERRLKQWKEDDKIFVSTEAEKQVMRHILTESCVTLIGNSGTGKSFLSRHVALKMMEQGYFIIPCDNPGDIRQWFKPGRKTLFVFDDVCGRYTLNQQIVVDWKQRLDHITSLLDDKSCKIMTTCRLDVSKDEQFSSLSIFKTCVLDLSSEEFGLTAAEKFAFAEVYLKENRDVVTKLSEKYDCFPLLCSLYHKQKLKERVNISDFFRYPFDVFEKELMNLYRDGDVGKMKYCSLVLCAMFNNALLEDDFSTNNKKILATLDNCELNKGTSFERLKKSLETLEGTYVVKEDNTYKIIHDKLFDFLAKYFGEKMLQLFFDHAHIDFIKERFLWKNTNNFGTDIEFTIKIPDNKIKRYIDRLLIDWGNGFVLNVFANRNMSSCEFTKMLIKCLNKCDQTKQEKLACTQDKKSKDIALAASCYNGSVDMVKWLISKKSNINFCTITGKSPLFWASQNGHVNIVKELLKHSAEVNPRYKNCASPLCIASQKGHVGIVKELLLHSADVNICGKNGFSPLSRASYFNKTEVVKVLLQSDDVDINLCDNDGCSSLYWASQNGYIDVVKELLQHSAEVNQRDNNDVSPLFIASQKGHVDVVKVLLQHTQDVNKCSYDGVSPLSRASHFNQMEVVKVLLQCDEIDINLTDNKGRSALYWASRKGHVDVVKKLLQHSADVNQYDYHGNSALYIASQMGHVDVVRELLQHSPDVNKYSIDGVSPLSRASYLNRTEVVEVLLQCDAVDINLCDNNACSSLYWASQGGHIDIVKELLQHAADVNQCDNNGVSPLYTASEEGHVGVVNELLQHSAKTNHCDNDGTSPLFIASQEGHVEVVTSLLQHSAEVNLSDNDGTSPLCIASQNGHVDVVKELLQYSPDVNKCSNDDVSPLSTASYFDKMENVKIPRQYNMVDINLCDDDGRSALYWASQKGYINVVKELLQHSANVHKCDKNGISPLNIAQKHGYKEVELLLLGKDANRH